MPRLPIDSNASAMEMANAIFGDGVQVVGASYSGDNRSSGIYSNGDNISPEVTPGDTGVILSTGRASSFTRNSNGNPNASNSTSTNTQGVNNDADFNALAGANTYDAAMLDVDFIPTGDTLSMQFVFSSDEYPEFVNSIYNDAVGVWVNGQPATLSVGSGNTNVQNISDVNNINLYNDNTGDAFNTEMDGFTATLTLKMAVIPNQVNSIRIGIADVGDSSYDSNLLIAGDSLQTALMANDDTATIEPGTEQTFDLLANDEGPGNATLTITHINGQEVFAGDTITLATGQQITLNADGTVTVLADADTESVNFSYTVGVASGNLSDTAFVTIDSVPCFVAGTRIRTPQGEVPIEMLKAGDLVMTLDDGPQPLRWVGRRKVAATGDFAPIRFRRNAIGTHGALKLSPQHRVLISDATAELLFGDAEVLVKAKDLVNDHTIVRQEGGTVEYFHLLFEKHQVIFAEGMAAESFFPGPMASRSLEADIVAEICTLFPELNMLTGDGYGAPARRILKTFEARVLTPMARVA